MYIFETMLKGVVYSIKLKLELAVLGKLVKLVSSTQPNSRQDSPAKGSVGFVVPSTSPHGSRKKATTDDSEGELRDMDISEFVDLSRLSQDVNHPSHATTDPSQYRLSRESGQETAIEKGDYELARFEHVEDIRTWQDCNV